MKKTLLIVGGVLLAAAIGTAVYMQTQSFSIEGVDLINRKITYLYKGDKRTIALAKDESFSVGNISVSWEISDSKIVGAVAKRNGKIISKL